MHLSCSLRIPYIWLKWGREPSLTDLTSLTLWILTISWNRAELTAWELNQSTPLQSIVLLSPHRSSLQWGYPEYQHSRKKPRPTEHRNTALEYHSQSPLPPLSSLGVVEHSMDIPGVIGTCSNKIPVRIKYDPTWTLREPTALRTASACPYEATN